MSNVTVKQMAPFIRGAFLMYVSGRQIKYIVEYFAENGILSSQKKPLSKTSVNAIVQNSKYIREYQYRDVIVPDR